MVATAAPGAKRTTLATRRPAPPSATTAARRQRRATCACAKHAMVATAAPTAKRTTLATRRPALRSATTAAPPSPPNNPTRAPARSAKVVGRAAGARSNQSRDARQALRCLLAPALKIAALADTLMIQATVSRQCAALATRSANVVALAAVLLHAKLADSFPECRLVTIARCASKAARTMNRRMTTISATICSLRR